MKIIQDKTDKINKRIDKFARETLNYLLNKTYKCKCGVKFKIEKSDIRNIDGVCCLMCPKCFKTIYLYRYYILPCRLQKYAFEINDKIFELASEVQNET